MTVALVAIDTFIARVWFISGDASAPVRSDAVDALGVVGTFVTALAAFVNVVTVAFGVFLVSLRTVLSFATE